MRKACIELIGGTKVACLLSGTLGMGKCLFMVAVSEDMSTKPSAKQWARPLSRCQQKAASANVLTDVLGDVTGGCAFTRVNQF